MWARVPSRAQSSRAGAEPGSRAAHAVQHGEDHDVSRGGLGTLLNTITSGGSTVAAGSSHCQQAGPGPSIRRGRRKPKKAPPAAG